MKPSRVVHDVPIRSISSDEICLGDMITALYGEDSLDTIYIVLSKRLTELHEKSPQCYIISVLVSTAEGYKIEVFTEQVGSLFAFAGVLYDINGTEKT